MGMIMEWKDETFDLSLPPEALRDVVYELTEFQRSDNQPTYSDRMKIRELMRYEAEFLNRCSELI